MMSEIWQISLAVIGSFCCAGAIIWACSRWLANITAEKIIKKTEFEFAQKLEDFKSQLEKKNYISKTRFDLEIELYRELSETTLDMVFENNNLFTPGISFPPIDEEERRKYYLEKYESAIYAFNKANETILRNAPFIPENIFKMFLNIRNLCREQISSCRLYGYHTPQTQPFNETRDKAINASLERTSLIDKTMKELLDDLRIHIANFDVLD